MSSAESAPWGGDAEVDQLAERLSPVAAHYRCNRCPPVRAKNGWAQSGTSNAAGVVSRSRSRSPRTGTAFMQADAIYLLR